MTLSNYQITAIGCSVSGASPLGLGACRGKAERLTGAGRYVQRDLGADVRTIRSWGARAMVTLLPDQELLELGVAKLGVEAGRAGLRWLHMPLLAGTVPDMTWEARWAVAGPGIHALLDRSERVFIHCEQGLGRSGMVAARILIERGATAAEAMQLVRTCRPGAINEPQQEVYLMGLDRKP